VTIGCTAYPTPFAGALDPQPFRCLRAGMPASYCGTAREKSASPPAVPWSITRNQGLRRPVRLLLQGIVEDSGSGSALAVSVSNAVVVDVRDAPEVEQSGKVAGAVHIPRGMLEFRADPESPYYDQSFAKDKPVIVYCAAGGRAALAGQALKEMGYGEVYNLGGFKDWADAGGAIDKP